MLQINTRDFGTTAVVLLQGQIVNGESDSLRKRVRSLSGFRTIKLDLARVSIIDANGLGLLLSLRQDVESKGHGFELTNVNTHVRRVLEMTRLDTVFPVKGTIGSSIVPSCQPSSRVSLSVSE